MSMGIPSICVGTVVGGKAHTREEYIEIDSLLPAQKAQRKIYVSYKRNRYYLRATMAFMDILFDPNKTE